MDKDYVVIENFLTEKECDILIREALKEKKKVVDAGYRKCDIHWLYQNRFGALHNKIKDLIIELDKTFFHNDPCVNRIQGLQFTVYHGKNKGKYAFHSDGVKNGRYGNRRLSMTIQLSHFSDYEGGGFEFRDIEFNRILKKGDAIIFNSFLKHRGIPVTKGTRYVLVTWSCAPSKKEND